MTHFFAGLLRTLRIVMLSAACCAAVPALAEPGLTLPQAETLWREHNREIRLARAALDGAEADTLSAAQRPNPQLSVAVSSLNTQPGLGAGGVRDKMMDTVIGVSQLVERGDKRDHRMRGARSRFDAARQDFADALRSQRLALHQAYYDVQLAQEKSRIAEDGAALYRDSLKAGQLRLKAGDIAAAELSRIRVEALRAENEARQAAGDLVRARLALAYLIGREATADSIRVGEVWPDLEMLPSAPAALDQRPDVQAAEKRVQAAGAARDLARSLKSRDVTVGMQFEHNPTGSTYAANSYGVSVSVPLFLGYAYEGEIRRAETDLQAAREQLEQVRAQALAEQARARSDLEVASQRAIRYRDELLAEAERAARAAEFAYQRGAMPLMDLLDARRTWKATQLDAATARADQARALSAWRMAAEPAAWNLSDELSPTKTLP
jgi:cobalt-zinc-cadmium efflux system outer membrane protein